MHIVSVGGARQIMLKPSCSFADKGAGALNRALQTCPCANGTDGAICSVVSSSAVTTVVREVDLRLNPWCSDNPRGLLLSTASRWNERAIQVACAAPVSYNHLRCFGY